MLFKVLQRLSLRPMVRIVVEVAEELSVILLPVSKLCCHGSKLSEVAADVWCFLSRQLGNGRQLHLVEGSRRSAVAPGEDHGKRALPDIPGSTRYAAPDSRLMHSVYRRLPLAARKDKIVNLGDVLFHFGGLVC